MPGIVYVLSNPAMPNLVKIGKTTQADPQVRVSQLYTVGVPLPFECEIAVRVEDEAACERALHAAFADRRINPSREFFELDPEDIKPLLRLLGDEEVTPGVVQEDDEVDAASLAAVESYKKRKPRMNFEELGIPVGATLTLARTGEQVTVASARSVIFRGEEMSISQAGRIGLEVTWSPVPGSHWRYEGRLLRELYAETYG